MYVNTGLIHFCFVLKFDSLGTRDVYDDLKEKRNT